MTKMNKKGDFVSVLYTIVVLAAVGILLFMMSGLFSQVYDGFHNVFEEDPAINNSEADMFLDDIIATETPHSYWDYAFLGIVMGYILLLSVLAYSTPISHIYYLIFILVGIFGLVVGVILSNIWQTLVATDALSIYVSRFPIMNAILGNFYPLLISVILVMVGIIMFGKNTGGEQR